MIRVPFGLIFQASCAVSAGIGAIGCGYIDMDSLLVLVFTLLLLSYNYFSHSPAESDGVSSRIREQFLLHAEVIETDVRWLGGKTLLTDEIIGLLPTSMHESFAMLSGPHPTMMLGCVWFRQPPKEAARQFWPSLSLQHTED